jgi:hypothetical protein
LMLREIDQRFNITSPLGDSLDDSRRASHLRHTYVDLIRQRVYQMAAGYEDCNKCRLIHADRLPGGHVKKEYRERSFSLC